MTPPTVSDLRTAVRVLTALGMDPATVECQAAQYLCVALELGRRVRDAEDAAYVQERHRQWALMQRAGLKRKGRG